MPNTQKNNQEHIKILIIRFSSIGDLVLTTPLIRAIKNSYPNAEIDYLTLSKYASLVKYNPRIRQLYALERLNGLSESIRTALRLRRNKYDYIFDLHRSTRSLVFRLLLFGIKKYVFNKRYIKRLLLTRFGINLYIEPYSVINRYFAVAGVLNISEDKISEIWIKIGELNRHLDRLKMIFGLDLKVENDDPEKNAKIEHGLIHKNRGKIIALMPFARWKTKEWGDSNFIELGRKLSRELGATIIILGGNQDLERARIITNEIGGITIPVAGKLTLLETAVTISMCDLLVTNDTGAMHIGGAVSVPVIALFGSTTEELGFFPLGTNTKVLQTDVKCRPCTTKGLDKCPRRHFNCMNEISVDAVYSKVKFYLQKESGSLIN